MRKTGQQLIDQRIIIGEMNKENVQQVGVDLNLIKVERIEGVGFIPRDGKTILAKRQLIEVEDLHKHLPDQVQPGTMGWYLMEGAYDITLGQGCSIPSNASLEIIQRSSGLRNGLSLVSSMFDPGFETKNIGTIMHVKVPIALEFGCRIGQAYSDECYEVDNLYDGQWQGDKQRTEK